MIRRATERDIPQIVEWGRALIETTPWAQIFREEDYALYLRETLQQPDAVLLVSDGGFIRGEAGGHAANQNARFAVENQIYAEDGSGRDLLAAFEQWAREKGAVAMFLATNEKHKPQAARLLYGRLGYEPSEQIYTKVL